MSKEFSRCPNCGNETSGDDILKCKKCGAMQCEACKPSNACRDCDNKADDLLGLKTTCKRIGTIK